jgi:hypothetical protein
MENTAINGTGKLLSRRKRRKAVEPHEDVELLQQQIGKLTAQIDWLKKKLSNTAFMKEKNG